jgi:hypothetical protein
MTLDTINETRTLVLLTPYIILYIYYYKYVKDYFFIKPRADIQLLFMIYGVIIIFLEIFAWAVIFKNTPFLGFNAFQDSGQTVGIIIGAAAAIIGWLFTTRAQAINSTKANTMKILMESRFSDEYARNLKTTTKLFMEQRKLTGDNCCLSTQDFEKLKDYQLNSINYMLNYFEFIAVGIRCGDLDEQFMRQTLRTIILTNFKFYKLIIEEKQKKVPSALENLTSLSNRWS